MPVADRDLVVRFLPFSTPARTLLVAVAVFGVASVAAVEPPAEQPPLNLVQAEPAPQQATANDALPSLFVTDRVAVRRLRLAEERIARGTFNEAVELLQAVLDAPEDSAAAGSEDDGSFYSLKGRALALLDDLPAEGQQVYELKYGTAAAEKLKQAVAAGDWAAIETLSRRFFHTKAGYEATYRLATRAQDRGEPLQAAVLFEMLTGRLGERYEPQLSFRTASAWKAAGFPEAARAAGERFLSLRDNRLAPGGTPLPPFDDAGELLVWLGRHHGGIHSDARPPWPAFGRDADRTASVEPVTVAGGVAWTHRFDTPTPWDRPRETIETAKLSMALETVTAIADQTGELTQPAFSPVIVDGMAVVRTLRSIQAVDLATGELLWRTEHPHDVVLDRALDGINLFMQSGSPFGGGINRGLFLEEYVSQYAWRNLTSGTLSTDGQFVYGIEGVGTAGVSVTAPGGGPRNEAIGNDLFNTLYAYDLAAEGRIAWTVGGPPPRPGETGTFFLGPPLPLGGRLYALAEQHGEIRLLALDPKGSGADNRVIWSQSLIGTESPVAANPPSYADPLRKISGLSPSFAEGVLVCPTGSGAVVAIDPGHRLLRWGYQYDRNIRSRSGGPGRPVPFMAVPPAVAPDDEVDRWLDAAPQIAAGRVYVTPRDSDELHCIDLRDGSLIWKMPRGSLLYLAAVDERRVIVVGRNVVQALDAATREVLWTQSLDAAEPAGRGVRSGDLYHLPINSGEIVTLRLSTGQELGRSPVGEGVRPGNLIAAGGRLLMQSTEAIAGFRKRDDFETELRERLTGGADPAMLALRGEHRLHRGETQPALSDLRQAVEAADLPRARRLLTEALLEGLRTDFDAYRKYEADLLRYADDPQQRLALLRLLADGQEQAGEPQAAFTTYLRLCEGPSAAVPLKDMPLEEQADGTVVRADRLFRVRIAALYAGADRDARRAMEALLVERLTALEQSEDGAALERFASLFRGTPIARSALASVVARYESSGDRLRAEHARLRLEELSDADAAISATANAAAPEMPAGQFGSAYRAAYLPDEIRTGRSLTEVETRFTVQVIGPLPPDYDGWQFEIDAEREHLQARDPYGRVRWKVNVRPEQESDTPLRYAHASQVRFCGHILAFAAGTRLVVLDLLAPGEPRILWTRDLHDRRVGDITINRQRFRQMSSNAAHGPIGFAGAGQLLYQAGNELVAADPLTGQTLWRHPRIPPACEITGDDEFVVLHPLDEDVASVLRAVDGAEPAGDNERSVEGQEPVAWVGTRLVSWQTDDNGRELVCRDVARNEEIWSWSFPETAEFERVGTREVAVLDPPTGTLQMIDLHDGEATLAARIDPAPAIDFVPLRSFGRLLVFTQPDRAGQRRSRRDDERRRVDGLAYAFDDQGERLWSAEIPRQRLSTEPSAGLPVLFLTTTVRRAGRPESHQAAVLDVRTGRLLVEQQREREFLPYEMRVDSGSGTLTLAVPDARFVLTPTDDPLPPALGDGPQPTAEPPAE